MNKIFFPRLSLGMVIVIVLGLAKLLSPVFEDPDFYWHLKTGEYLLGTWPLGRADVFSFPNAGHPWVLSEWGSQIILYTVFHAFGFKGVTWFVALICALCLWAVLRSCFLSGCGEMCAVVMTMICGVFLMYAAPRPHLFTFLLFAITLHVLLEFKYLGKTAPLWVLPVLMAAWANLHGGYFVGLVLMAAFCLCEWLNYGLEGGEGKRQKLNRLTLAVAASLLATLLNPEFVDYWWYPIKAIVLSGDAKLINEWQSPNFHEPYTQYFLLVVIGFMVTLAISRKRPDVTELFIPMMFIVAALVSVRNIPLAVIAVLPFLGRLAGGLSIMLNKEPGQSVVSGGPLFHVIKRFPRSMTEGKQMGSVESFLINIVLIVAVGFSILLIYPIQQKRVQSAVEHFLPVKATDFILHENIRGRVYNAYQYGGYLIYRLFPAQQVFIYGRNDIFTPGFLQQHDTIYQGRAGWKKLFDRYHFDYVVCETNAPIRQLLRATGTFKLVYDDGNHSVLVRNEPQFYPLIARFGK